MVDGGAIKQRDTTSFEAEESMQTPGCIAKEKDD